MLYDLGGPRYTPAYELLPSKEVLSPLHFAILAALAAIPMYFALPTTRGFTPDELMAYLPLMDLDPTEAVYVEALCESYRRDAPTSLRAEVIPVMRRLVDEHARLDLIEAQLADQRTSTLQSEVDAIRLRLATLTDESAREALQRSIDIAERRLSSVVSETAVRERVEAHREMIRQSALAAGETVRRLRHAPDAASDLMRTDFSGLLATADGAGRDVAALEAAVLEMRAL